eukprot:6760136-Alexandrium_andersonii.AAC.1
MSASLVGSEMCIRDSAKPPPARALLPAAPPCECCASSSRGTARCGAQSVSYTHLTLPTICSV